jgi:hypothetical protein
MDCSHSGFRDFCSHYDHGTGVLVYYWICERCGERLSEARREEYRPLFDPRGNDPYLVSPAR